MKDGDELLTLREAYNYLRISRSTILRMRARGEIQAHKVGNGLRFYEKDIKKAVRAVGVEGASDQVELVDTEGN
jgi:excisionase family DNA binding protein